MVPFWKGIALALIACILALTVQKQDKTYAGICSGLHGSNGNYCFVYETCFCVSF